MKATLAIILLSVVGFFGFLTTEKKIKKEHNEINFGELIKEEKAVNEKASIVLHTAVNELRSDRDTVRQAVPVTKTERFIVNQVVHDTVYIPQYKTVVKTIYVGNKYDQTNNTKFDTIK